MKDTWILLRSGRNMNPFEPRPEDFCIEDIAHALSNIARFNGHTNQFYPVAQHCELVSWHVGKDPVTQMWGLMHDAAEAYIGDMASPIKAHFPEFNHMETRLLASIADRFGLPARIPDEVWVADKKLLAAEWRDLMPDGIDLPDAASTTGIPTIIPKSPEMAQLYFIHRFNVLQQAMP